MLKKGSFLRELPIIVVSALIVSIVVKTFLLHFFYIPTGSMENTLQIGDRIAVNKFGALFSEVKRGEVVVFGDPDKWLGEIQQSTDSKPIAMIKSGLITVGVLPDPAKQYLIKRVIGVGGDNVTCCDENEKLQVNGISIDEPYIYNGDKPVKQSSMWRYHKALFGSWETTVQQVQIQDTKLIVPMAEWCHLVKLSAEPHLLFGPLKILQLLKKVRI